MLRACARLLRPQGRLAFYSIFAAPGLSKAERARARDAGPFAMSLRVPYASMLRSAGFTDIEERDATPEFLETSERWYTEGRNVEAALRPLMSDEEIVVLREDRRIHLEAVQAGLLRRSLFTATKRGGRR